MKGIANLTQMEEDLIFNEAGDPGDPEQNTNGGIVELGVEHVQTQGKLVEQLDLPGDDLNLGLSFSWTIRTLSELVKLHRPGLAFLSETKCKSKRVDKLKEKLNYHGFGVDLVGKGSRLSLLWRKDIEVWLQSFLGNHINVIVKFKECPTQWRIIGFYGNPDVARRKETWNLLRNPAKVSMRPWFCGGDFNVILGQHKKQGTLSRAQWQIDALRACLSDLGSKTWVSKEIYLHEAIIKKNPHTVRACFDRAISDSVWAKL
ncbi:hypothetical protein Sango_2987400 [Sesamum angolense]|uniref:Endonuclease/exonuclease/phosphatase domain-containing protein n=1 Tax=Sesamum angolense TaxID=2727404 RepID=A0AAE1T3C4_9LAMI|nr:hypothetical protein Sango_2987400 [Sesamum angolense]